MSRILIPNSKLLPLLLALLAILDCGLAYRWNKHRDDLLWAAEQLQECEDLAQQIELLRMEPTRIEEDARSSESFNQLCESAASSAGIESERIIEIAPRVPRRLENTSYQEQVTLVEIREITLQQLFTFVAMLRTLDAGLHIRTLSLREPPGDTSPEYSEAWNVQMALTTYIYAPKLPNES